MLLMIIVHRPTCKNTFDHASEYACDDPRYDTYDKPCDDTGNCNDTYYDGHVNASVDACDDDYVDACNDSWCDTCDNAHAYFLMMFPITINNYAFLL